ncbi:hypothetical protein QYE76_041212 [Lolium multiflorum]|uniref:CCHC-type domain-containing protein n=1 Tax=Lolium multiflorum TaxID=4521 RepID=A0AAD8TCW7_LOLMU|nr:hypothetical protein QYE76_041212 [Lolium multiflorum]
MNKSTTHKRKKGQGHVKDPAKIVCFKCKIEGHHVRSCPLKKKPLGEKKQGKRPQDGAHGLPQGQAHGLPRLEERPLPKKDQAKAPVVEKSSEKKENKRTCYICHEKGHISSFCTIARSVSSRVGRAQFTGPAHPATLRPHWAALPPPRIWAAAPRAGRCLTRSLPAAASLLPPALDRSSDRDWGADPALPPTRDPTLAPRCPLRRCFAAAAIACVA